jgi:hypothetical protein
MESLAEIVNIINDEGEGDLFINDIFATITFKRYDNSNTSETTQSKLTYNGKHNDKKEQPDLACFEYCNNVLKNTPGSLLVNSTVLALLKINLEIDFSRLKEKQSSLSFGTLFEQFKCKIQKYNQILLNYPLE